MKNEMNSTDTATPKKAPDHTNTIEAYGVMGMKNTPWRKTFKSEAALNKWVETHDAEVYATSRFN